MSQRQWTVFLRMTAEAVSGLHVHIHMCVNTHKNQSAIEPEAVRARSPAAIAKEVAPCQRAMLS